MRFESQPRLTNQSDTGIAVGDPMNDAELMRLRRLRELALRSRAIARAMAANRHTSDDPLLLGGAMSSWRIVRAVSGKLKSQPDVRFHADIGIVDRSYHQVCTALQLLKRGTRSRVLREYLAIMRQLSRQLDDARSLTLSADLSDTFGRTQSEINVLTTELARQVDMPGHALCRRGRECRGATSGVRTLVPPVEAEWPYLSLGPRLQSWRCTLPECLLTRRG